MISVCCLANTLLASIIELTSLKENGGHVVLFEKYADVKLVDHTRKNLPPDAYGPLDQLIPNISLIVSQVLLPIHRALGPEWSS